MDKELELVILTKTPAKAGEINTLAGEQPDHFAVVAVLGVGIVAVQVAHVLIAFDVEDLEVAVGVRFVRDAFFCHCFPIP